MDYHSLVEDFARRTRSNLSALRQLNDNGIQVFEVTALLNSMLGLLVFPQQAYVDQLPEIPFGELVENGWPTPRVEPGYHQASNLKELVRLLRNAISHCNLQFNADSSGQIVGLALWNIEPRGQKVTWHVYLSVPELEALSMQFVALLLKESPLSQKYLFVRP